ncbi:MAG: PQQ-binding-like beta-propeller repeat protein [Alphaproteobacteria bacterium]|nr:PQQ-binding-like beta-propeller repeat protein [Alphaproteobacteria bacterium]
MKRVLAVAVLLAGLTACDTLNDVFKSSALEKGATPGDRASVIADDRKLEPDASLSAKSISLPPEVADADWPFAGGGSANVAGHPALPEKLERAWSTSIGSGSGSGTKLLARPVASGGKVYAMDAEGNVAAVNAKDGDLLWETETEPEDADDDAMGGGIAFADGKVFATTGYGEVLALDAADGKILWRRGLGNPFRSAPAVSDGRVYVVGIDNETHALSEKDGTIIWRHAGISESTSLMGASSPAVLGDTVVVAYTSGEIFALRAQNGRPAWGDVLAVPQQVGALPAMADIRGMPVVDRGGVFAMSHSGPLVAISQRRGERVWELDVGGINTPVVAGNIVTVLTNDNKLVTVTVQTGRVVWVRQLENFEDPEDKQESERIVWSGPVLAGGRMFLVNSFEQLLEISPFTGEDIKTYELPDRAYVPPIVAGQTLYVVTDDGELVAYR